MRRISTCAPLIAIAFTAGCALAQQQAQGSTARAVLADTSGRQMGDAQLRQSAHGVHVQVQLQDMSPGTHAIHVHETGRCQPTFEAAGSHWNPNGRQHGFLNEQGPHLGDLPNLHVGENGRGRAEFFLHGARLTGDANALLEGDGTALIVHAGADDHRTDPSGNSGNRILCGAIMR